MPLPRNAPLLRDLILIVASRPCSGIVLGSNGTAGFATFGANGVAGFPPPPTSTSSKFGVPE